MWFFGKKRKEAVKKEAEAIVAKILQDALTKYKLETSGDMASGLQNEFMKMNKQILDAFDRTQHAEEVNSESIAILAQSIASLSQAVNILQERIYTLESQLSVSSVKFTKGTTN